MRLPEPLREAIDAEVSAVNSADLARASCELTEAYKGGGPCALSSPAHRAAYLRVRLPATYASNLHALAEVRRRIPQVEVRTMLDLGAGPGTAMWAAAECFPKLEKVTLIERDRAMVEAGRRLALHSTHAAVRSAEWVAQEIGSAALPVHHLVVISYAWGEVPRARARELIAAAWNAAAKLLVVIEPGTRRGFASVHETRAALLEMGGRLVAPCPHALQCPMAAGGDWCHFAQRVERTAEHRRAKGGTLGYEDEKFSYIAAAREAAVLPAARIVRHPAKHSGHVELTLCTDEGLQRIVIAKSQKESYRAARKAEWGDAWGTPP